MYLLDLPPAPPSGDQSAFGCLSCSSRGFFWKQGSQQGFWQAVLSSRLLMACLGSPTKPGCEVAGQQQVALVATASSSGAIRPSSCPLSLSPSEPLWFKGKTDGVISAEEGPVGQGDKKGVRLAPRGLS